MEEEWIVTKISASKEDSYVAQPRRLGIEKNEVVLASGLSKEEAVSMVSSIGNGRWLNDKDERLFICRIERV